MTIFFIISTIVFIVISIRLRLLLKRKESLLGKSLDRQEGIIKDNENVSKKIIELETINQELKKQNDTLLKNTEDLKKKNEFNGQFLACMSHEVRTPLNAIIGITELLNNSNLNNIQKEYVDIVASNASSLWLLINDIFDYSKFESGKIIFDNIPFRISDCIDDVVKTFINITRKKGLELSSDIDSTIPNKIKGDPKRVRQILINIINNAIKFTDKGRIHVQVNLYKEDEKAIFLKFIITDSGIGIKKENLTKIFNLYMQADDLISKKYGGTGLGLAISRYFVKNLEGEIGVNSDFGKGSEFWFTAKFLKGNEFIADFNNEAPRILETLRFAIESENFDLAKIQASNLKNYASLVSANNLEKLSGELENCLIKLEINKVLECFKQLEIEYNRLQKEIF